jgi:hypothetical protein
MVRSPQPLSRIFAVHPAIAEWDARRLQDAAVYQLIRRHLPRPLADRVRVAISADGVLELAVDTGAIAAMLRQRSPELLAALRSERTEFTGIRIRVQVRVESGPAPKATQNQPDRESLLPLAALAAELPPSPLKAALQRLIRRAR